MEENSNNEKLLPEVPVYVGYEMAVEQIKSRIAKLNEIKELTKDNEKEVKAAIAEINKVKDKVSRYRIDNTESFLRHIEPWIEQCKTVEKLCSDGVAEIKDKVKKLEQQERDAKKETIKKLFEFTSESFKYAGILDFEMFFEDSMANKSTNINVIEKQLKEWFEAKSCDLDFINKNVDEVESVIAVYLGNGLNLPRAIEEHQNRYKSESEIKAMIANDANKSAPSSFEKKIDITLKIYKLPQSKVAALQSFMGGLGVEWEIVK